MRCCYAQWGCRLSSMFSIRTLCIEMFLCLMGMPFVVNDFFSASERIHNILRKFKNHNHNLLIFWFSWKFIDCSLPWMFFIFFLYRLWWALDCLPLLLMKATLDLEDGMYVTFTTRAESHNTCVTMSLTCNSNLLLPEYWDSAALLL